MRFSTTSSTRSRPCSGRFPTIRANPLVGVRDGVAVEEHADGLDEALLPLLVRHLVAGRVEPGDVLGATTPNGPAAEPAPAPEDGMAVAEVGERAGPTQEGEVVVA